MPVKTAGTKRKGRANGNFPNTKWANVLLPLRFSYELAVVCFRLNVYRDVNLFNITSDLRVRQPLLNETKMHTLAY